jgi:hypothetical protein
MAHPSGGGRARGIWLFAHRMRPAETRRQEASTRFVTQLSPVWQTDDTIAPYPHGVRLLFSLLFAWPTFALPQISREPRSSPGVVENRAIARFLAQSRAVLAQHDIAQPSTHEPPAPGVAELKLGEIFGPIGDRGLEFTPKARSLAGQRVRVTGFMVREPNRSSGRFRVSGWPVAVENTGLSVIDDAPAAALLYVVAPDPASKPVGWRPGRLVLTGTLELGSRPEPDGRNSFVRLLLTPDDYAALSGPPARSESPSTTP